VLAEIPLGGYTPVWIAVALNKFSSLSDYTLLRSYPYHAYILTNVNTLRQIQDKKTLYGGYQRNWLKINNL